MLAGNTLVCGRGSVELGSASSAVLVPAMSFTGAAFLLAARPEGVEALPVELASDATEIWILRFLEFDPLKTFGLMRKSLAFGGLPLLLLCCGGLVSL